MRRLVTALVSITLTGAIIFGGYTLYNVAYLKGETAGYDRGYPIGQEAGYKSGEADGYSNGYDEGYSLGKTEGYDDGYSLGKEDGYGEGYSEGIQVSLGHGYTLKDPTHNEALDFIKSDKTNENEYVEDAYVCSHFSRDVCNNAEAKGLRCAFVEVRFPESGHAIIAFDTIDKGLVYFDAQTDESVRPVLGKRYYQCIVPKPGYSYAVPAFDDTINDILVIW